MIFKNSFSLLLFLEVQMYSCVQNSLYRTTDVDPNFISSSSFRKVNMSINLLLIKTLRAIDINLELGKLSYWLLYLVPAFSLYISINSQSKPVDKLTYTPDLAYALFLYILQAESGFSTFKIFVKKKRIRMCNNDHI